MSAKEKAEDFAKKAQVWLKEAVKKGQEDLDKIEFLQKLEQTTHVPKLALVGGTLLFVLLLFLFNEGARFVVNVASFVFPAYESFRAIEKPGAESKLWLSYWIFMGALNFFDIFSDFITYWLPFYYILKLAVVVYLWHPRTRGIKTVHDLLIKHVPGLLGAKAE